MAINCFLLALDLPNCHLHPQHTSRVFCWQLSGSLICICQTSWAQNCNQIMHVEQSMMGSHCDRMMWLICWRLLACYYLWRHSVQFCQWPIDFLEVLEKQHRYTHSKIHYTISGIVPVTTSKEVWGRFFTSIQMENKFTFTLCTNMYHHQDLGQIRFLIQCPASSPLLLRTCKMVGIPFCVLSSSINVLNKTRHVYEMCTNWFSVTCVPICIK